MLEKDTLATVLEGLLSLTPTDPSHSPKPSAVFRSVVSAAVMTAFASANYTRKRNHFAEFEAWILFLAHAAAGMTQSDFPAPSLPLIALDLLFVVGGLVLTIFGARFLVTSAIEIATAFNVSETVIGLTIVAVGTSLPELVTSVMAALRKHSDIAFGNIVGSNIYNIFGILGVTAIIKPIDVPSKIASLDIWVMIAATVLLFITATSRWRIGRVEGGIMLAAYVGYCVWLGMNSAA